MTIEASIYSRLSTDAQLTALVSTRIYPIRVRQGAAFPAVAYARIATDANHILGNLTTGGNPSGLFASRFSFDCWSKDDVEARNVAAKIRSSLDGYSGTILGVTIWGIIYIEEFILFDPDSELFREVIDFRIMHN